MKDDLSSSSYYEASVLTVIPIPIEDLYTVCLISFMNKKKLSLGQVVVNTLYFSNIFKT